MGFTSKTEYIQGKEYRITTFDSMQKYTCVDCNNKIKSNTVVVGSSENGSEWICEDCLQKRKDEIPMIVPKAEVKKDNPKDNAYIERIEKKFVKGIECKVYHYKEGVLTYCNNCNHNAHKMVEFQKDVEKYWMCSKCFHDYISGNVSSGRTIIQTDNPEYKKVEEQSLLGINYKVCTSVKGKSFYCDYCGHNRKRVVEIPVIGEYPKMCFHCFSSKTKTFQNKLRNKSNEEILKEIRNVFLLSDVNKVQDKDSKKSKKQQKTTEAIFSVVNYKMEAHYRCDCCKQQISSKKVIIYQEGNRDKWLCENCYREMKNQFTDIDGVFDEKKKQTEQYGVLPEETIIYVGVKGDHECAGPMSGTLMDFKINLLISGNKTQNFTLKKCPRCGKIFIPGNLYTKWSMRLPKYKFITKKQIELKKHVIYTDTLAKSDTKEIQSNPIKNIEPKIQPNSIRSIEPKNFLTRTKVFYCSNRNHQLIDIQCRVKVLRPTGNIENIEVPAAYCSKCNKYYILETEYQKLKSKGIIICKVVEQEFWTNGGKNNEYNLNQESLLHIMGYNVNAQAKLSKLQRWKILEVIVDEKIFSRTEICSHLDYLINRSKHRKNFQEAISKWQTDRNHIMSYNSSNITKVEAKSITRNVYKK